jgi:opacity protein-like surface antigen
MSVKAATVVLLVALPAIPAHAQIGIGGRMSMVRGDVDAGTSAERFTGGHIRAMVSPKTGIEVALDRRSETNEAGTERVREYPLQASLMLFPVRSVIAPYLIGGGGWYTTRVEAIEDDRTLSSESTRKFGWHGGFGAELRMGRHVALHADYRYTHLRFGDDDESAMSSRDEETGLSRILPSYKGSMWTAGLTVYF